MKIKISFYLIGLGIHIIMGALDNTCTVIRNIGLRLGIITQNVHGMINIGVSWGQVNKNTNEFYTTLDRLNWGGTSGLIIKSFSLETSP